MRDYTVQVETHARKMQTGKAALFIAILGLAASTGKHSRLAVGNRAPDSFRTARLGFPRLALTSSCLAGFASRNLLAPTPAPAGCMTVAETAQAAGLNLLATAVEAAGLTSEPHLSPSPSSIKQQYIIPTAAQCNEKLLSICESKLQPIAHRLQAQTDHFTCFSTMI